MSALRQIKKTETKMDGLSRLDQAGAVSIDPYGMYTIDYIENQYPEQIFHVVLRKCQIVQGRYIYGKSWIAAIESVIAYEPDVMSKELPVETLLCIDDVMHITQTSRDTIERNIKTGDLKASDHSSNPGAGRAQWRIRRQDLEEFFKNRQTVRSASSIARIRPISKRNQQHE